MNKFDGTWYNISMSLKHFIPLDLQNFVNQNPHYLHTQVEKDRRGVQK